MSDQPPVPRSFSSLYQATVSPLRRHLARILGNTSEAEDVAHDAYWARQARLTKPPRSLGQLEELGARLARLQGTATPAARAGACIHLPSEKPDTPPPLGAEPTTGNRAH